MYQEKVEPVFQKILVIDDNPIDCFIVKRMAEKNLFAEEIVSYQSAYEALEYLHSLEHAPHLLPQFIFLDINMPVMDGYEFMDEYLNLSETIKENCVISIITNSINPDDFEWAENNPFIYRFFNKPLDKEKFRLIEQEFSLKISI